MKKVTWTKGIDPETGKPVEYDSKNDVQNYNRGGDARPGKARSLIFAPATWGARTGRPPPTIRSSRLWYMPVIESCNRITVKPEKNRRSQAA